MLCQRCQRHLRNCEGIKCGQCESRFHLRCVGKTAREHNSGDRAYQWKCALCQNSKTKIHFQNVPTKEDTLLNTINAISEKFELINKIQLPKLSNDLLQLKNVSDNIVKQNEDILRKIDEFENWTKNKKVAVNSQSHGYRNRCFNISAARYNCGENEKMTMLKTPEKAVRYRPRRRSYLINKIFNLLNKKLPRRNS